MTTHPTSSAAAVAFLMILCCILAGPMPAATAGISLSISAEKSVVKSGSEARVQLVITNTSDRPIRVTMSNPAVDYQINVDRPDGKFVPETAQMQRIKKPGPGVFIFRIMTISLKSGQKTYDTIPVGYLFDMSEPGDYQVQIERPLPEELGHGIAQSNSVTITVAQ